MALDPKKYLRNSYDQLIKRVENLDKNVSIAEKELLAKKQRLEKELQDWFEPENIQDLSKEEIESVITSNLSHRAKIDEQLKLKADNRSVNSSRRLNSMVNSVIGSKATASTIGSLSQSPEMLAYAHGNSGTASPLKVRREMEQNSVALFESERDVRQAASSVQEEGGQERFVNAVNRHKQLVNRHAQLDAISQRQRKSGTDEAGIFNTALENERRILAGRGQSSIEQKIRSGHVGSLGEEKGKLIQTEDKLINAMNQLTKAMEGKDDKEKESASEEVAKANAEYSNQKSLVQTMQDPGFAGKLISSITGVIGNAGTMLWHGTQAFRSITNTQPLEQDDLRIRGANYANQQFSDVFGATQGDAAGFRRATGGLYDRQISRARAFHNRETVAQIGEIGGNAMKAVDKGAQSLAREVEGGSSLGSIAGSWLGRFANPEGSALESMSKVGADLAPDIASIATQTVRAARGIPQTQVGFEAADKLKHREDAENFVNDKTTQAFFDYNKANMLATIGSGSGRGGLMQGLLKPEDAVKMGLSPQDITRLTSSGVQGLGSQFGGMGDITRAGQMQRVGYMSADDYVQRTASLSNVGGSSKDLEDILQRAVAAGMDSSKNVGQLIAVTQSISTASANAGVNTASASGELVGRGIESLDYLGDNKNMKAGVVANSIAALNGNLSDSGFNLSTVLEMSRYKKDFGKASMSQMGAFGKMNADQMQTLANATNDNATADDIKKASDLAYVSGTESLLFGKDGKPNKDAIRKLIRTKRKKEIEEGTLLGNDEGEKRKAYDAIDKDEAIDVGSGLRAQMFQQGVNAPSYFAAGSFTKKSSMGVLRSDINGAEADGQKQIDAAALGNYKMVQGGEDRLTETFGSISKAASALETLASNFKPADLAGAAKSASDGMTMPGDVTAGFGKSVGDFDTSVKDFTKAVDKLSEQMSGGAANKELYNGANTLQRALEMNSSGDSSSSRMRQ